MPPLAPIGALAAQVGQTAAQNELSVALGLSTGVAEAADRVRVNRRLALVLSERVNGITNAIASALELGGSPTQEGSQEAMEFEALERVLRDVHETLSSQGQHSYLSQLVHQKRDREDIARLSECIDTAYEIIMIQLRARMGATAAALESQLKDLVARHRKELPEPATEPENITSPPPKPALHLGRDSELEAVIHSINDNCPGRVIILGGPGMGKTTLATAALHHPSVKRDFGTRRYFVACDAAEGQPNPFRLVAEAFGALASDLESARQHLHRVLKEKRTLLVLDNFESAWEAPDQREGAESLLQFLGSFKILSLVVTMRGAERPQGIQWSHPLLPPLSSLSESAAKQTFLSIADCGDSERALDTFLHHIENVPLALVLLANMAQCETLETLLQRWNELETAMLTRGNGQTKLTSLDVSIRLSLQSARVQADGNALNLLSLLSLLPCGTVDEDIAQWGVPDSARAVSVLLRTSLIARSGPRICTLAPIRSFVLANRPPGVDGLVTIYQHYFGQAEVAYQAMQHKVDPEIYASLQPELSNIEAIVRYSLIHSNVELQSAIRAVVHLCFFRRNIHLGPGTALLPLALETARREKLETLEAELLNSWAHFARKRLMPGDPQPLFREAHDLYQRIGDRRAAMEASIYSISGLPSKDAICEGHRLYSLAEAQQDLEAMAQCKLELGFALAEDQKFGQAIAEYRLSIGLFERMGMPLTPRASRMTAANKLYIAYAYHLAYNFTSAIAAYHDALTFSKATHNAQGVREVYSGLADISLAMGHTNDAIMHATSALEVAQTWTSGSGIKALLILAEVHGLAGDIASADTAIGRLGDFKPWGGFSPYEKTRTMITRGAVAACCGNSMDARNLLCVACTLAHQTDVVQPRQVMMILEGLALGYLSEVECAGPHEATELAILSAAIFRVMGDYSNLSPALIRLAETLDDVSADLLLQAVAPRLYREHLAQDLAIALVRYATLTQNRGELELAARRARKALEYFGDIKDERRRAIAQRIIDCVA